MEPENPIENLIEKGPGRPGLDPAEQVALQVELLRMAGVRYLAGDPGRLRGAAVPAAQRPAPIPRTLTGDSPESRPAVGTRLADLAKLQPPRVIEASRPTEPAAPPRPVSLPVQQQPKVTGTSDPVPATPVAPSSIRSEPIQPVPLARASGSLFALDQVGSEVAGLPDLDSVTRQTMLDALKVEVAACQRCPALVAERTQTVFGVGPVDAELCVVGEAPGFNEDKLGEPFVGEAGQLLNKMLGACGFDRSQVYICNILRCRPPANRQPQPDEAQACHPFLVKTLELVRPKFLCLMGATATRYLLDQSTGVGVLRKRDLVWRGIPVQATYHPAYLLRYPDKKRDAWEDLQRMLGRMGRKPPEAS
jgi:DNA polymerase